MGDGRLNILTGFNECQFSVQLFGPFCIQFGYNKQVRRKLHAVDWKVIFRDVLLIVDVFLLFSFLSFGLSNKI